MSLLSSGVDVRETVPSLSSKQLALSPLPELSLSFCHHQPEMSPQWAGDEQEVPATGKREGRALGTPVEGAQRPTVKADAPGRGGRQRPPHGHFFLWSEQQL